MCSVSNWTTPEKWYHIVCSNWSGKNENCKWWITPSEVLQDATRSCQFLWTLSTLKLGIRVDIPIILSMNERTHLSWQRKSPVESGARRAWRREWRGEQALGAGEGRVTGGGALPPRLWDLEILRAGFRIGDPVFNLEILAVTFEGN